MKSKSTLYILMFIMLINSLSYGIIIPLLYPYAIKFGIDQVGLGYLFASFSLAQFLATPVLGRLSDRFGRKPVLLFCLLGSSLSLGLMAAAQSAMMLFFARLVDGATGGNNSVAQAVIADQTTGEERTKAFGMIWAAFGFGFLIGPAIGGILSNVSLSAPFWFAATLAFVGTVLGSVMLKETLPPEKRQSSKVPLFPIKSLLTALFAPMTGIVLLITLLTTTAQNAWVIGFQSFTVDILKLSPFNIGLIFSMAGLITIIMQAIGIRVLLQKVPSKKKILTGSLILTTLALLFFQVANTFLLFVVATLVYVIFSSPQTTMFSGLLSERTKAEDQGGIMGIGQAYMSLGQILGPLLAGYLSLISIPTVFLGVFGLFAAAAVATRWLASPAKAKLDL
jgi:MFS family permease